VLSPNISFWQLMQATVIKIANNKTDSFLCKFCIQLLLKQDDAIAEYFAA
jgi:hypothetical protein